MSDTVNVISQSQRAYVDQVPKFSDISDNTARTMIVAPQRDHHIKPFNLIDPEGLAAPFLKTYAKGRTTPLEPALVSWGRNVTVSGTGLILSADKDIYPESCIREHHAFYSADKTTVEIKNTDPIDQISNRVSQPTIILTGVWPLHFSHWTYDNYAKLCFVKQLLGSIKGYKVAVGFGTRRGGWCKPTSVQFECLSLLGIKHEDVIMLPEDKWTHFDQAIFMTEVNNYKPPVDKIWNAPEIMEFFDDVFDNAKLQRRKPKHRIHLSRIDNANRKCMNETEVLEKSADFGFEDKTISGMTMAEQMQYFSDIEIACGPAGNNLITMFAMQRGSKIVTYFPSQASHIIAYYQSYCSDLGIDLYAICGSKFWWEGDTKALDNLRWDVDVSSVIDVLDKITG